MSKMSRNERRKLAATLLAGLALSLIAATLVAPGARLVEQWGLLSVPLVSTAVLALVFMARRSLRDLED
jgi:hypothetical protein